MIPKNNLLKKLHEKMRYYKKKNIVIKNFKEQQVRYMKKRLSNFEYQTICHDMSGHTAEIFKNQQL